jgi:hypothetical protein
MSLLHQHPLNEKRGNWNPYLESQTPFIRRLGGEIQQLRIQEVAGKQRRKSINGTRSLPWKPVILMVWNPSPQMNPCEKADEE